MNKEDRFSILCDLLNEEGNVNSKEMASILDGDGQDEYAHLKALKVAIRGIHQDQYPSQRSSRRFDTFLEQTSHQNRQRITRLWLARAAAILLLLVSGLWLLQREPAISEGHAMESMASIEQLLGQESTTQKIQGIQVTYSLPSVEDPVVDLITDLMYTDPSPNVRIAAARAIENLAPDQAPGLFIKSLKNEKTPIVQIALIEGLVRMKNKSQIPELNEVEQNAKFSSEVLTEWETMKFELEKM